MPLQAVKKKQTGMIELSDVCDEVVVGQGDALGRPGRSGRVGEGRGVVVHVDRIALRIKCQIEGFSQLKNPFLSPQHFRTRLFHERNNEPYRVGIFIFIPRAYVALIISLSALVINFFQD
jgi:hypothetical protein